jgi:hypothetical protein
MQIVIPNGQKQNDPRLQQDAFARVRDVIDIGFDLLFAAADARPVSSL